MIFRIFAVFSLVGFFCSFTTVQGRVPNDTLKIYVTNYPLKYLTERIAGQHAQVIFPVPPDVDPALWRPDRESISHMQQADLIILNGAGHEKWINKVSLPQRRVVYTSQSFKDRYVFHKQEVTHRHGPQGKHAHGSIAFTTWLDFTLAVKQAQSIVQALSRKLPEQQHEFAQNLDLLTADLLKLDGHMQQITAADDGKPLLASHPVYQYLARRYGLNLKSADWETNIYPDKDAQQQLRDILKQHPARWMLWEGEPLNKTKDLLKSMDIRSLVFYTCANAPETGDFLTVMQHNVEQLRQAFR